MVISEVHNRQTETIRQQYHPIYLAIDLAIGCTDTQTDPTAPIQASIQAIKLRRFCSSHFIGSSFLFKLRRYCSLHHRLQCTTPVVQFRFHHLMIIVHEYPIAMVEHHVFRKFVRGLQPYFKVPCRNTVKSDILKIYDFEKQKTVRLYCKQRKGESVFLLTC